MERASLPSSPAVCRRLRDSFPKSQRGNELRSDRVFLARSLRRQRRVHQYFVDRGEGGGGGQREAASDPYDPISLLIVLDIPLLKRLILIKQRWAQD